LRLATRVVGSFRSASLETVGFEREENLMITTWKLEPAEGRGTSEGSASRETDGFR